MDAGGEGRGQGLVDAQQRSRRTATGPSGSPMTTSPPPHTASPVVGQGSSPTAIASKNQQQRLRGGTSTSSGGSSSSSGSFLIDALKKTKMGKKHKKLATTTKRSKGSLIVQSSPNLISSHASGGYSPSSSSSSLATTAAAATSSSSASVVAPSPSSSSSSSSASRQQGTLSPQHQQHHSSLSISQGTDRSWSTSSTSPPAPFSLSDVSDMDRKFLNTSYGTDRSSISNPYDRRSSTGVSGASTPSSFSPGTSPSFSCSPLFPGAFSSIGGVDRRDSTDVPSGSGGGSGSGITRRSFGDTPATTSPTSTSTSPTGTGATGKKKTKTKKSKAKREHRKKGSESGSKLALMSSSAMPPSPPSTLSVTTTTTTTTSLPSPTTMTAVAVSPDVTVTGFEYQNDHRLPMNIDLDSLKKKVKPKLCEADIFRDGFRHFLHSGDYSDLTLECEGKEHKVHRLLLAYSSEYFSRLLLSNFQEGRQTHIRLRFPDPANVFPLVLQFIYQGHVTIAEDNVIPLLAMADHYLVQVSALLPPEALRRASVLTVVRVCTVMTDQELQQMCSDFVNQTLSRDNALSRLRRAIDFNSEEVILKCLHITAKNFSHASLGKADYTFLPVDIFMMLLHHRYLAVKSEQHLFNTVCTYVEAHHDSLTEEQINELMEAVRFRWLSYEQLEEAARNALVPRHLLVEALMAILRDQKYPDLKPLHEDNPRLQERVSYGIEFEYQSGVENNDIFWWIGTNSGTDNWQNPALCGRIKVTISSIEKGDLTSLFFQDPSEFWTKDVPASWVQLDLGLNRAVVPTYYTVRHGGTFKADSLRTWDFQGSVDGSSWSLLRRHVNDESLNDLFATHSWSIEGQTKAYRLFRILQTGHNSSNHNFLVLSGLELYGALYEGNIEEINRDLHDAHLAYT